jgi:hypothetical protein
LYRYWNQVLLEEGAVKGDHPCFTSWFDLDGEKCIFNDYQLASWSVPHLRACPWYLEMPIDKTPQHEQVNRRSVEPSFFAPDILPAVAPKNSSSSQLWGRKAKSNAKSVLQPGQKARQDGSVTLGKRGHRPIAAEVLKRSRVQEDHLAQFDPNETTQATLKTSPRR